MPRKAIYNSFRWYAFYIVQGRIAFCKCHKKFFEKSIHFHGQRFRRHIFYLNTIYKVEVYIRKLSTFIKMNPTPLPLYLITCCYITFRANLS